MIVNERVNGRNCTRIRIYSHCYGIRTYSTSEYRLVTHDLRFLPRYISDLTIIFSIDYLTRRACCQIATYFEVYCKHKNRTVVRTAAALHARDLAEVKAEPHRVVIVGTAGFMRVSEPKPQPVDLPD